MPKVSLTIRPVLDSQQIDRLATALGPDQAPMLWLGVVLGLRWGEAAGITALVAAGIDIKTAQTRLGHANPALKLAIYARATVEADRRAADAVGERFRPRDGGHRGSAHRRRTTPE